MFGFQNIDSKAISREVIAPEDAPYVLERVVMGNLYHVQVTIKNQLEDFEVDLLPALQNLAYHHCLGFRAGCLVQGAGMKTPSISVYNMISNDNTDSMPINNIWTKNNWHFYTHDTGGSTQYFTSGLAQCDVATHGVPTFIYTKPVDGSANNRTFYQFWGTLTFDLAS